MGKEKAVNYTDEMVARLHEVYNPEASDDERKAQIVKLADELGRSAASIRAKLVNEGIYQKYERKTKTGEKPESKETIVKGIAEVLSVDADSTLSGLEKATKNCLLFLRKTLLVAQAMSERLEELETSEGSDE